jgi:O-glycosyl hydrolase
LVQVVGAQAGGIFFIKEKLFMRKKWHATAFAVMALAAALVCASCLGEAEEAKANIVKPYISIQPMSASYFTDEYADVSVEDKTLSMEIWDWTRNEGSLSFQWYSFEDIETYCASRRGTAISGASGRLEGVDDPERGFVVYKTTYTPDIQPEAGKQYFYYVNVTNNNPDADTTSSSTPSEIAIISFSAPGAPLYPVISRHPASATYGWGAEMSPLRVEASLPEGAEGTLTYQWYSNSSFSVTGGTAIAQADQSTLLPDEDMLNMGANYSFVVVTNNVETHEPVRSISLPATITLQPGKKAAPPRINVQPQDQLYFTGETVNALTVEAVSLDRGSLSYQWYSNETVSSKGGTAIDGARSASYTPPVSATGNYFYYVVVTNTNNNVSGQKTETTPSRAVKVSIASSATGETANAFIWIPDPDGNVAGVSNRFQYIRGFGGMDVAWGNFPRTRPEDTELMYDPDRMGYNILRIMIRADYVDPEKTVNELLAGDRPDYYENVKIVNKYGGYVLASPWTPPKEWKSNNSINGGGNLIPSYYKLFATYLRNFAQLMYDNGAPIYAISISNEPNYVAGYDGCEWEPEEMRDFFLEVGHFTNGIRGYGGGREIPYVLTMNGESANTPNINHAALENSRSKAAIDVLARHVYGERTTSLWKQNFDPNNTPYKPGILRKSDGSLYEVWMTEHNINSANATGYYNDSTWPYVWRFMNDVDLVLRINSENAFVWWASKRFYSMIGDGQFGTVGAAEKNEPATPYPRGWGLSHYARYTIDTTRIRVMIRAYDTDPGNPSYLINPSGAQVRLPHAERGTSILNSTTDDMDNTSVRVTGFISQDGNEISLVMWTPTTTGGSGGYGMGTVKIDLPPGFEARSVIAHRSWGQLGTQMFQLDTDQEGWKAVRLSPDRTSAYVDVPRSHILSVKFTR